MKQFRADMQVERVGGDGRLYLRDMDTKIGYMMFPGETSKVIKLLYGGKLHGEFKVTKKGPSVGLCFIGE